MNKTRKMPVSTSFGDFHTKETDLLIPALDGAGGDSFLGIKTGRHFPYGGISYIGRDITARDVVAKLPARILDSLDVPAWIEQIDSFLGKLQAFKIGNTVRIERDPQGNWTLIKVAERPPQTEACRLPG